VRPALCVFISDPEANRLVPAGRLEAAFDLTAAEARLAALLAAGDDLRSAAAKLRITYGTARARLAQIFQKTETRRQAELVRLLLATVAIG
jgi:DNA-binding CsgD family transcriptional regulator